MSNPETAAHLPGIALPFVNGETVAGHAMNGREQALAGAPTAALAVNDRPLANGAFDGEAAIPLDAALAGDLIGKTHKSTNNGDLLGVPDRFIDVAQHGGLLAVSGEVLTIRAPARRMGESEQVRTNDVMRVHRLTRANSSNPGPARISFETEGYFIDRAGHLVPIETPDNDPHPEGTKGQWERAGPPRYTLWEAAWDHRDMLLGVHDEAAAMGLLAYSGSLIGDRGLTADDLNMQHLYVGPIINYLGGPEVVARLGASEQCRNEDSETAAAGAFSFNVMEGWGPIDMALTAASPHAYGQVNPELVPPEPYPQPEANEGLLAARLIGRLGLPSAVVIEDFVPEDPAKRAQMIDAAMRAGRHSPGRYITMHGNRDRVDDELFGGRENCSTDTNGGHTESSVARLGIDRAARVVLESAYMTGDIERLADRFPSLINLNMTERIRRGIMANYISMSQVPGLQGPVVGYDGKVYRGVDLLEERIRLALMAPGDSPYEVTEGMVSQVRQRAAWADPSQMPVDAEGLPTVRTSYTGGPGPVAAYARARVLALVERGVPAPDAIAQVQAHQAVEAERYLRTFSAQNLGFLVTRGGRRL